MARRLSSLVLAGLVLAVPLDRALGEAGTVSSAWHASLHALSRDRLLPGEPPAPCSGAWQGIVGTELFRELACAESLLPGDFPARSGRVRLHLIAERDRVIAAALEQRLPQDADLEVLVARLEGGLPAGRECVSFAPRMRQCRYAEGLVTISTEPPPGGAGSQLALLYVSDADRFAAYLGALQRSAPARAE